MVTAQATFILDGRVTGSPKGSVYLIIKVVIGNIACAVVLAGGLAGS